MLLVVASAACSPPLQLYSGAAGGEARSTIIAFKREIESTWTTQLLDPKEPLYLLTENLPITVMAVSYDRTIEPESLKPTTPMTARACELLDYTTAKMADVTAGEESSPLRWTELAVPSTDVDAMLLGSELNSCTDGCWAFRTEELKLPIASAAIFATHTSTLALLGYADGSLVQVGLEGEASRVCRGSPVALTAGAWRGGDRVWLAYADGTLATLSLAKQRSDQDCQNTEVSRAADGGSIVALDISAPSDGSFELFALSRGATGDMVFFRRTESELKETLSFNRPVEFMAVQRMQAGSGLATFSSDEVALIDQGEARLVRVGAEALQGVAAQSVISDEAGGAWVGVERVGPMRFTLPPRWEKVVEDNGSRNVLNMARFPDRTTFTTRPALLGQLPDRGFRCPYVSIFSPAMTGASYVDIRGGTRLGDTQLIIGAAEIFLDSGEIVRHIIRVVKDGTL